MKAFLRTVFLAILAAGGVTCGSGVHFVAAETGSGTGRLSFDVADGRNLNSFLRVGPVAAHLVLRGGTEPRLLVAFPAGDSGVGVWFAASPARVTWRFDEEPQPVTFNDEKDRPLHGIVMQATATAPELVIKQVILSSVRVLRDFQTFGSIPPEVKAVPDERRQTLTWMRDRLDGAAGYRLSLEVTHGQLKEGRIVAARDGKIGMKVTALSGDTPLTPLSSHELFDNPRGMDRSARNVLTFLSFKEKFLAGSWRYNTYFGRDTLMSIRLLLPALTADAVEDGLGSVLARLSSTGEVAHEEDVGEFAILDHLRTNGALSDAPVFDYKMIDGSFMLAPVAREWLLETPGGASRAAAFLARKDGGYGRAPTTFGADLVTNLRFVVHSAAAFANQPLATHLIGLKPGIVWGQWRDSDNGIAHGRYPYDVNAIFVPAALEAAARFYASGLLDPYLSPEDRAVLAPAAEFASVWRTKAGPLFNVEVPNAIARSEIESYSRSVDVSPNAALRSSGGSALRFHALALDVDYKPIPILNSDEGFDLLFGSPDVRSLDTVLDSVMRPFPAGLMTDVGMVVANPVFAAPELQAQFGNTAYHGTVIWSWQQAVLAAGFARQLQRRDLPDPLKTRLRAAQRQLWRVIGRGRKVINSELWSWSYRDGHYDFASFGAGPSDIDESNAAQLWSTVYLAIRAPAASSQRH
jgi:hypothetical protein